MSTHIRYERIFASFLPIFFSFFFLCGWQRMIQISEIWISPIPPLQCAKIDSEIWLAVTLDFFKTIQYIGGLAVQIWWRFLVSRTLPLVNWVVGFVFGCRDAWDGSNRLWLLIHPPIKIKLQSKPKGMI